MDGGIQRTSTALLERTSNDVVQLLKRFENIVALAPVRGRDRTATAVDAYQMEVETAALIRAAEDLLSLSRSLKEAWLFGKLNTVREDDGHGTVRKDAQAVGEVLERLLKVQETL